ncbi:MAG: DUF6477 family protein [Marinovum sp.]|nr:DUF6477 family protein [Marinovum sp.]
MKDVVSMLQDLHRPRLLIQAARIGSEQYHRTAHLPRLLGFTTRLSGVKALMQLIEIEQDLDEKRRCADPSYSVARHVDVLSAMMGEARVLRVARATQLKRA